MRTIVLAAMCMLAPAAHAADVTVVPIDIREDGHIAHVRVSGVTLRALIDTSGYRSVGITPAALAKLRVRYRETFAERIDGAGNRFRGREFEIPELRLGNSVFRDVPGFERLESDDRVFGSAPFDVAIGRDFLSRFTVIVDYPHRRIMLHEPTSKGAQCRGPAAALAPSSSGVMYSVMDTDAGPMRLAWDTGAIYSVVQQHYSGGRELLLQGERFVTHLALGAQAFGPHRMVVLDLPGAPDIDGLLGANFFSRHRVCLDYPRRLVTVH